MDPFAMNQWTQKSKLELSTCTLYHWEKKLKKYLRWSGYEYNAQNITLLTQLSHLYNNQIIVFCDNYCTYVNAGFHLVSSFLHWESQESKTVCFCDAIGFICFFNDLNIKQGSTVISYGCYYIYIYICIYISKWREDTT